MWTKIVSWFKSLTWAKFADGCWRVLTPIVDVLDSIVNVFSIPAHKVEITTKVPAESLSPETCAEETEEEKIIPVGPGDFVADENDGNLFHSLKNKDFSVRVIKNHSNGKERDKDQLVFATSLPHKFNAFSLKAMQSYCPQLIDLNFSKSHELLVTKSAACKFDDLQDSILRFIFVRLDREYSWLHEEQVVLIEKINNSPNYLSFNLKVQTCKHLELGVALIEINGISSPLSGSNFPLCMDHANGYDFNLEKGKAFTWEELFPEIREVFASHFKAGVKFTFPVPTVAVRHIFHVNEI